MPTLSSTIHLSRLPGLPATEKPANLQPLVGDLFEPDDFLNYRKKKLEVEIMEFEKELHFKKLEEELALWHSR